MRLGIFAVGRLKTGPEKELYNRYADLSTRSARTLGIKAVELREVPESRQASPPQRQSEELAAISGAIGQKATLILLDERGDDLDSRQFAAMIRDKLEHGVPDLIFGIGGPDGHDASLRERASLQLRFGPMTWPHRLVRIMLAEQIYRALAILSGHPYHRDQGP